MIKFGFRPLVSFPRSSLNQALPLNTLEMYRTTERLRALCVLLVERVFQTMLRPRGTTPMLICSADVLNRLRA